MDRSKILRSLFVMSMLWIMTSCSDDPKHTGVIDETESTLTGAVYLADGKPAVGASVYLHGEGVKSDVESETPFNTIEVKTDEYGKYAIKGVFNGQLYVQAKVGEELGVFKAIEITNSVPAVVEDLVVLPNGFISLDFYGLKSTDIVWVREINQIVEFTNGSVINIPAPQGVLTLVVLSDGSAYELSNGLQVTGGRVTTVEPILAIDSTNSRPFTDFMAKWDFNNALDLGVDSTGNEAHAWNSKGLVTSIYDTLALFDDQSGLSAPLTKSMKDTRFSIYARIFPISFGDFDYIIGSEPIDKFGDGWSMRLENGYLKFRLFDSETMNDWVVLSSIDPIPLFQWTNIDVYFDGKKALLVINDKQIEIKSLIADISSLNYPVTIGYGMEQNSYFNGKMDYLYLRSGTEIITVDTEIAN